VQGPLFPEPLTQGIFVPARVHNTFEPGGVGFTSSSLPLAVRRVPRFSGRALHTRSLGAPALLTLLKRFLEKSLI
jgi:hypothetical protein